MTVCLGNVEGDRDLIIMAVQCMFGECGSRYGPHNHGCTVYVWGIWKELGTS